MGDLQICRTGIRKKLFLKIHYLILLLCPLLPINPKISSQLTDDSFKKINTEQERGNRNRTFGSNSGNTANYSKIKKSTCR